MRGQMPVTALVALVCPRTYIMVLVFRATLPSNLAHGLRIAIKTAFMTYAAIQKLPKTLIFDDFAAIFVLYKV
jgi:hypothetical protein